jgi:hypothetical protein
MTEKIEYQIEATVEKFEIDAKGNLTVQLKGCGKYCFEKENKKDKEKQYWNILENLNDAENDKAFRFEKQDAQIKINVPNNEIVMQHLLSHAFIEKKKLKFELQFVPKSKPEHYTIIGISHVTTS